MKRAARVDANQKDIVKCLRKLGCSVQTLAQIGKGCPDLLVGYRGHNYLIEVKDGERAKEDKRARDLTPDQVEWHRQWAGQVVVAESVDDAQAFIILATNR